jgi:hypothetical protein
MSSLGNLNDNPELAKWLDSLRKDVEAKKEAKAARGSEGGDQSQRQARLPLINMGKKMSQVKDKTYPEQQGTITLLPVSYKGNRTVEINRYFSVWAPTDDNWSASYQYLILPEEYYPEGEVREKIINARKVCAEFIKSHPNDAWKSVKRKSATLILGYVLNHRNTKGDVVVSNLYGDGELHEHKNFPALIVFPNAKVNTAIQDDLDKKPDFVPYAVGCYSDKPLAERQGFMTVKFTDSVGGGFGYDVSVSTDLVNPIVMPDGLFNGKEINWDDEYIKLLSTTDPIKRFMNWRQYDPEVEGKYYTDESLKRLDTAIDFIKSK